MDYPVVDLNSNTVNVAGMVVQLRPTGAEILSVLARANGEVVRHDRLLSQIYGGGDGGTMDTMHVHVFHLRRVIKKTRAEIVTVPWCGYALRMKGGHELTPMTAETCQAEMIRAQQAADMIDAFSHNAGKGISDRCQALARSLRDTAQHWSRMKSAIGETKK
jgi:DNA-binding winged helix-turn-helix (wHTH) protein